ncbi:hypothetical protein HMPREF9141_2348 [Prevotella multiformis DSM 16608]|uniref:Uncharacterized protein n=1 Tax=Prevotella multiformis DSM 16608 TaxID=888743 RepID=F0F9T1_9BACT|nr:hypothetical protein HMPREF9141_2348 [Prevotella multiformis DSM 16608]
MLSVWLQRKYRSNSFNENIAKAVNCLFCHHPLIQKPFQFNLSGIQTGF